jgi:hypothetical protein
VINASIYKVLAIGISISFAASTAGAEKLTSKEGAVKVSTTEQVQTKKSATAAQKTKVTQKTSAAEEAALEKVRQKVLAENQSAFQSVSSMNQGRNLPVILSYSSETSQKENAEDLKQMNKIWAQTKIFKGQRAVNVSDEKYNITLISTQNFPYIANSLYHQVVPTAVNNLAVAPCDLNVVGDCLVLERDSVGNKTVMKAYVIGTAPKAEGSSEIRIARRDFTQKSLQASIVSVLSKKANGIYVYSRAADAVEAQKAAEESKEMISSDEARQIIAKEQPLTDKELERKRLTEVIEKSTIKNAHSGSFFGNNKCAVTSVQSEERPNNGLKTVRRIFILD